MSLEEFVLTYRDENGVVCNIPDYYERYIKPLDKKFSEYSFYNSRTVICPLHDDNDPSLGLINHRFLTDVKIYHCFGCGASGTVIRLHQFIQDLYYGRKLSEEDSCRELADLFDISLDEFTDIADDDFEGKYLDRLRRIKRLQTSYTVQDFTSSLLKIRRSTSLPNEILHDLGVESIKMIATQKKLYI